MTEQSSALELRLRQTFVDLRPPDGAPDALRGRVAAVPEPAARAGWRTPARALARAMAVAAVVAVVVGVVALRPTPVPLTPGGPGTAPNATFDPMIEGPGILLYSV